MPTSAALRRLSPLWQRSPKALPSFSRWTLAADAALAALLTAGILQGALTPSHASPVVANLGGLQPPVPLGSAGQVSAALHTPTLHPLQVALAVLTAAPLVVRRRYPLSVLWVVLVAILLYHLTPGLDATLTFVSVSVAAYSAMLYSPYPWLATGSALMGTALVVGNHRTSVPTLHPGLSIFLFLIPIGLAADAVHSWRQRIKILEKAQADATHLAVERERTRIAQELHDVVTHNVSVMVVQAGAARLVLKEEPDEAEAALRAVESGGRAALVELRYVMGLLIAQSESMDGGGHGIDHSELSARPGLDQVEALVDRVRAAGVELDLAVRGTRVPLSASQDLAAYRVVQEALTNALKHAQGSAVNLVIDYRPGSLTIDVTDSGGTAAAPAGGGDGRGLLGLRERLAVYGGALETGPLPGGGYRVHARIPLPA